MNRKARVTIAAVVAAVVVALIAAAFLIGLWVGREGLSPEDAGQNPASDTLAPAQTVNTALHRLLVKKVPLHRNVSQGGALARLENTLYVFMNRNYDNDESLLVIDLDGPERYRIPDLAIPMNLEELLSSPVMEVEGFDLTRFRVYGLYAEPLEGGGQRLYATHSVYEKADECISFNLSRTDLAFQEGRISQASGWETIFTAEPSICPKEDRRAVEEFGGPVSGRFPGHMSGGKMIEYDDERVLVSIGSFHRDGDSFENRVSDPSSHVGKFLLVNKQTGENSIFAEGMRNAQGLHRDRHGIIWSTDHGPQGGDALNIIEHGNHYGWPEETLGLNYGNRAWPHAERQGSFERFSPPLFAWVPGIAPTQLIRVLGQRFPLWDGDLLVGSLINQSLHRLRIGEDNRVIYHERIELGHRLRDLTALPGGEIAILTDDGHLLILDDGGPVYEPRDPELEQVMRKLDRFDRLSEEVASVAPEMMDGSVIFRQKCGSCHSLDPTIGIGPHMHELFGRPVGGLEEYNYSAALSDRREEWSAELLKSFLLDPGETFPGSRMPPVPLSEAEAERIVEYLNR